MLDKWNYCSNSSYERFMTLAKRFSTLTKGTGTGSYDVKGNPTIELLLLLKYVYCKIILDNKQLVANQPFLTVEEIISCYKKYPITVKRRVLTDGIIMDENNNLTISYENFIKCLRILDDFQIVAKYADLVYAGGINNYIQNYDKYVTKSFCQNVEKISPLHIWQRLDVTAYECPIIFYQNNNLVKGNSWAVDNTFERFDKIIDWLLERCKHIETFEIGIFVAISQTLGFTEGLEAFEKFVKYAESLDDNNRISLINKLIAYYNSFNSASGHASNLELIPNIIKSLNLCECLNDYPESIIKSVVDTNVSNQLLENFAKIVKGANKDKLVEVVQKLKNNVKSFPKSSKFGQDNTLPMQNIIEEYVIQCYK